MKRGINKLPRYGKNAGKEIEKGGKKILPMMTFAVVWLVMWLIVIPPIWGCQSNSSDAICGQIANSSTSFWLPGFDFLTLFGFFTYTQTVMFLWLIGLLITTLWDW